MSASGENIPPRNKNAHRTTNTKRTPKKGKIKFKPGRIPTPAGAKNPQVEKANFPKIHPIQK